MDGWMDGLTLLIRLSYLIRETARLLLLLPPPCCVAGCSPNQ
jgi:hypothetical protein